MILSTDVRIHAEGGQRFASLVFLKARQIVGIPAEHPWRDGNADHERTLQRAEEVPGYADKWRKDVAWERRFSYYGHIPGGFDAMVCFWATDEASQYGYFHGPHDDEEYPGEYPADDPVGNLNVDFDTAYGYKGPNGEGCTQLHADYVRELGEWIEQRPEVIDWHWKDDRGEWHNKFDYLNDWPRS